MVVRSGDEPVAGPETSEEQFEILVTEPEYGWRHPLLGRFDPENAQGTCPLERSRTHGLLGYGSISVEVRPRTTPAGIDANFETTITAGRYTRYRVGELSCSLGEVIDEGFTVIEDVEAARLASVPLRY